jgi:hypothetical protein
MRAKLIVLPILLTATSATVAQDVAAPAPPPAQSYLPGVWALGETRNCEAGPAWVFLADGYYVEVTLPNSGPSAVGLWRDEGGAIAYTHSHMPFADRNAPNELRRLIVEERAPDRLATRNYRGVARIFHRCPPGALRAPDGQAAH